MTIIKGYLNTTHILYAMISITLFACSSESTPFKNAIKEIAYDPNSLEFRDLVIGEYESKACIQVLGKNRLGGYTGWQYVSFKKPEFSGSTWVIVSENADAKDCTRDALDDDYRGQIEKLKSLTR